MYVRISLDRTGQEAGVGRQQADCRALAEQKGWVVAGLYKDNDVSASKRKPRPEYQRLLADIRAGRIDAVVAWHPDRLYRRLVDLEGLIDLAEEHRVTIATVVGGDVDLSTASGRMQARILARSPAMRSIGHLSASRAGTRSALREDSPRTAGAVRTAMSGTETRAHGESARARRRSSAGSSATCSRVGLCQASCAH